MVVVIVNVNEYRTETFENVTSVSAHGNVLDILSDNGKYLKGFVLTNIESYEIYDEVESKQDAHNVRNKKLDEERKLSEGTL